MSTFPNLACSKPSPERLVEISLTIKRELRAAGISVVMHEDIGNYEVPAMVTGELRLSSGTVRFTRAWYYWMVECEVPLKLAEAMYAVEARRDVRVAGHCACPPPAEWAKPSLKEIDAYCSQDELGEDLRAMLLDSRCVKSYHIDTPEGLRFFADCMKAGKVPESLTQ